MLKKISEICGFLIFSSLGARTSIVLFYCSMFSLDKEIFNTIRLVRKIFSKAFKKLFYHFGLQPIKLDIKIKTYLINKTLNPSKISFKNHKSIESLSNFL